MFKDYIFWPLLCFPVFFQVLLGNICANLIRNLWTSTIIFCGHFTEEAHTFSEEECKKRNPWAVVLPPDSGFFQSGRPALVPYFNRPPQLSGGTPPVPRCTGAPLPGHGCRRWRKSANNTAFLTIPGHFFAQYFTVLQRVWKYSFPSSEGQTTSSLSLSVQPVKQPRPATVQLPGCACWGWPKVSFGFRHNSVMIRSVVC